MVSFIKQKDKSEHNEAQVSVIKGYREKSEAELAICEDILGVLNKHLILPLDGCKHSSATDVLLTSSVLSG
jgi:hypothetical protein